MEQMVQIFANNPWDKQVGETQEEYDAFHVFLETTPMERITSLPELCRLTGWEDWKIKDVAQKNRWLWRCLKHDVWLDAARKQGAIKAKFEIGESLVKLSKSLLTKVADGYKYLEDNGEHPSYREATEMGRLAIELQRAGFGLQGITTGKEERENVAEGSPQDYIAAAVEVSVTVRRKIEEAGIDPDDPNIIEGTVSESD